MHQNDTLLRDYRLYTRRIRKMLYLGGVLQSTTRSRIWSYASGLLVIFMCFTQSIFMLNFCLDHFDNLVLMSKGMGIASSFIAPALMAGCFLVKREDLMELHEMLDNLFEEELARDQDTRAIALSLLHEFDRPAYTLFSMLGMAILSYFCPPLFGIIYQTIHQTKPRKYRLLFPAKYLWIIPSSGFLFYLHFLYETFNGWCIVFTISAVDILFGFYAFQISSVLRAMSFRLMNPGPKDTFPQLLKTCVKKHQKLLRCLNILQDIYGIIILRMILTNAVAMCALIFEACLFTEMTAAKICLFISYMVLKLLQTFTYAWYGSLITSASEDFRQAIYSSQWTDSNWKVRTNVIITMMQKPLIITALKMCTVSVNMFTNIMNATISYLFLLQTLDEAE